MFYTGTLPISFISQQRANLPYKRMYPLPKKITMRATMKNITRIIAGWHTSGTNSNHDPEFITFKRLFKSALLGELKKIDAVDVVFSYGHYYISGFFTVNTQPYYFSIGDVRSFFRMGNIEFPLLYRKVKDYKDFMGEGNQWLNMETDMFLHSSIK
jgi:hypothetical protein